MSEDRPAGRPPLIVNGFNVEPAGDAADMWFLTAPVTREIAGTLIEQRGGKWRCRVPAGGVLEVMVPKGVADPVVYVADRVTAP